MRHIRPASWGEKQRYDCVTISKKCGDFGPDMVLDLGLDSCFSTRITHKTGKDKFKNFILSLNFF